MTTAALRRRVARAEAAFRSRQVMQARQRAFDARPPQTWASKVGMIETLIECGRIRGPHPPECAKAHTWDDHCAECFAWAKGIDASLPDSTR